MGREGHCRQISLVCVRSTCIVRATLGLPPYTACVLSPSTLFRLQVALQGVGPELCALSMPKLLRFRFLGTPQMPRLGWACILCLPHPSSSGNQELDECMLLRCSVPYSLLGPSLSFQSRQSSVPCVSSGELISCCDLPAWCQPSRISGSLWLETGSLFAVWLGMLSLGLSLSLSPPPASCLWWGIGQLALLLYLLSPLFWEWVGSAYV